jgi:hypothetical protein
LNKTIYLVAKLTGLKKPIAILLLIIHSFNLAGYPAIFAFLQHKASGKIIVQLDKGDYNDAQLVEVKIPYPLPYSTNWNAYERVNGEIEVNGIHYNYVKRKLSNDTLYMMCIPNAEKTKLSVAKHDYFNVLNGVAENHSGKKAPASQDALQKSFGAEYNFITTDYTVAVLEASMNRKYYPTESAVPIRALSVASQPPEA